VTIYADTDYGRLAAAEDEDGQVHVWRPGGGMLGIYLIDRFEGGKLTVGSLKKLFTKPTPCVGCFQTGSHARGCPTGANGSPDYN